MKKVGEVNFGDFKTEFLIMPQTEAYLKNKKISLASLLPGGWMFYEVTLFDLIDKDEDGVPDKKYGKRFKVIYNGIIEKRDLKKGGSLSEAGFTEKTSSNKDSLISPTSISTIKSPKGEEIFVKSEVLKE